MHPRIAAFFFCCLLGVCKSTLTKGELREGLFSPLFFWVFVGLQFILMRSFWQATRAMHILSIVWCLFFWLLSIMWFTGLLFSLTYHSLHQLTQRRIWWGKQLKNKNWMENFILKTDNAPNTKWGFFLVSFLDSWTDQDFCGYWKVDWKTVSLFG